MFTWLKERLARRRAEKRGREHFAAAEGSYVERCCIVGVMMAIEAEEIVEVRERLTPDSKMIFMMAYECCMMWAIKSGIETVLNPEQVQSTLLSMQRHLVKHGWYQRGAFEKIWAEMQGLMPIAMSRKPGAPPPYPVAEMLMAPNQAGYPLDLTPFVSYKFGIYVLCMIEQLFSATQMAAKEHLQRK